MWKIEKQHKIDGKNAGTMNIYVQIKAKNFNSANRQITEEQKFLAFNF